MTTVTTTSYLVAPAGGWTADDLDALPDDLLRYELVDGVLLVSAAPSEDHQIAQFEVSHLLRSAVPPGLRVLTAPFDVRFGPRRLLQPDIVVLPRDRTVHPRTPVLVVEVLSPSTSAVDLVLKRHVYEQGGIGSYWLVDPLTPSLTVLELQDGAYTEVAVVTGDEAYDAVRPYPVRVVPGELLR